MLYLTQVFDEDGSGSVSFDEFAAILFPGEKKEKEEEDELKSKSGGSKKSGSKRSSIAGEVPLEQVSISYI